MAMIGITTMRNELTRLARQAWDFDEINVWINGNGITVAPNSRPNQRVNFQSYVDGERRDAYQDALDYFRAAILVKHVPFNW